MAVGHRLTPTGRVAAILSGERFLVLSNAVGAGLGFTSGAYSARILGPEALGVVAVVTGVNASLLAFLDVRLSDLAASVFARHREVGADRGPAYQAGVLWVAVAGAAAVAAVLVALTVPVGAALIPALTDSPTQGWWLTASALAFGINHVTGGATFLLRFSGALHAIGVLRMLTQLVILTATVAVLNVSPSVSGALFAGLVSAGVNVVLTAAFSAHVWKARQGLPLFRPDTAAALAAFRRGSRVLLFGNLLSYAKLFQRSADVLVVGLFADDRQTGIYKLARSLVDGGLAVLQDAAYQVHFPKLLEAFVQGASLEFRHRARGLFYSSVVLTIGILALEAVALPLAVPLVFGAAYRGAEAPVMVLTATYVFITGCHPWLWAAFTGASKLGGYTIAAYCATLAQYLAVVMLFRVAGVSATTAMAGALAYYLVLTPITAWLLCRNWPEYWPWRGSAVAAEGAR